MKNKKLLYVLLPLVAVVWGLVIYRVVQSLESPTQQVQTRPGTQHPMGTATVSADSFQLLLEYRDPFLSSLPERQQDNELLPVSFRPTHMVAQQVSVSTPPSLESTRVEWPEVKYSGLIEHREKNKRVAMLRINEVDYLLSEKQVVAGIKLVKLLQDSVLVEYRKERRFVKQF